MISLNDTGIISNILFRYRLTPTFGNGVIQRFRTNPSAMKKLAGRDYEDLLQVNIIS